MARFLAVGNLSSRRAIRERTDVQIFFPNPDVEFFHVGAGRDVYIPQERLARSAVKDALNGQFELIFAGSDDLPFMNPRKSLAANLMRLAKEALRYPDLLTRRRFPYSKAGACLAAINMDDRPVVDNGWFPILDSCVCFFKRELCQNPGNSFLYTSARTECNGNVLRSEKHRRWINKLRPISLGIDPETCRQCSTVNLPKKTDVFFAGDIVNRPNRLAGYKQLERLKEQGFAIDLVREKIPHEEFLRRCAQAHIVWSPEGLGWDCFRHYEAAVLGAVPLMQSPTIQRYAPLEDGEHALYYYIEGDHLAVRIREALQNRARLGEMGLAARRHVLQWHTHEALGRYVIEETRRTLAANASGNTRM